MAATGQDFDLQPDPRILPMLGEINFTQWKCAAELIDNAIDGFLSVIRSGGELRDPEIQVLMPLNEDPNGRFKAVVMEAIKEVEQQAKAAKAVLE
jgi:hypothetical protein